MSRVLIVDDSKTAQIKLKKLLVKHHLTIDSVLSGEEALDYLRHTVPSLIFLDHHMKGIDGLETLKQIKQNPRTAMTPVVMYTSERGDIYTHRAHTLGASEILSKDIFRPAQVDDIVNRWITQSPLEAVAGPDTERMARRAADNKPNPQLRPVISANLVTEELTPQIEQLRQELQQSLGRIETQLEENNPKNNRSFWQASLASHVALWLILALIVYGGFEYLSLQQRMKDISSTLSQVNQNNESTQLTLQEVSQHLSLPADPNRKPSATINYLLIEWIMNNPLYYSFGAEPLHSGNLDKLKTLALLLTRAGIHGEVEVGIARGDYCLQKNADGGWEPAQASTMNECTFMKDVDDLGLKADNRENYQTQLDDIAAVVDQQIQFKLVDAGTTPAMADIPQQDWTPENWNQVAAQSNRLVLKLHTTGG